MDTVVAAETGSGKTHGYLIPLVNKLCATSEDSQDSFDPRSQCDLSLVLCPNVMLCEQVVRMANSLCDINGKPFLRVAAISGRQVCILLFLSLSIIRVSQQAKPFFPDMFTSRDSVITAFNISFLSRQSLRSTYNNMKEC